MKAKRILSVIIALAMVMGTMGFTVFAEATTVNSATELQAALDNCAKGTTIQLAENVNYGVVYLRPSPNNPATKGSIDYVFDWTGNNYGYESLSIFEDLTIKGATGAVIDAIEIEGGTYYNTAHSQSATYPIMQSLIELKNVVIDGVTFTGKGGYDPQGHGNVLNFAGNNIKVNGLTVKDCVLNDEINNARLMYKTESTTYVHNYTCDGVADTFVPTLANITVSGCTFNGGYMGLELRETENLTISGNTFNGVASRDILIPVNSGCTYSGTITITDNVSNETGNRFIRASGIGDANLVIKDNKINNYAGEDADFIKVDGATGECSIIGNTLDGVEAVVENNNGVYTVVKAEPTNVAKVGDTYYTDLQEAIKAASPNGTVEIIADVTVDTWNMFSQSKTIGNGKIITLEMDGLTINGNGHSLTVNSVESANNGGFLFDDPENFTIRDLTINVESAGGIGIKSGKVDNVTFNGGNCIFPGDGEIIITNCKFNTAGHVIYYETARDNLTVCNNTFNVDAASNVIILRGNETFTGNTINSGRTVNAAGGSSPTISGNTFADNVRLKIYNTSTATISDNTITVLAFNDESPVLATFGENNMSEAAQAVLDNAVIGTLPNAEVIDLGALTIDEYSIYNGSLVAGGDPIDLHVAMEFIAKDTAEEAATNAFGNYTTDFFITMDGIEGGSFVADGCYLAGNYGTFGWIMIPLDEMTVEEGVVYPVITSVGFDFKYTDICTSVKDFKCGIYFSDDVIAANPDMNVTLTLGLSESMEAAQSAEFITVDEPYTYATADFGKVAQVGETVYSSLEEAIAKAKGEEVKLLSNVTISAPIVIAKGETLTIDLGGKNILYSSDVQGEAMISNSGTLTINDDTNEGAIVFTYTGEADSNYGKGNYTVDNRGSMTLNGGTIEIKAKDCEGKFPHALYALENYSGFDLTINGGRVYNANNIAIRTFGAGDLTVNDGEIEGLRAIWLQLPGSDATVAPAVNLTVNGGTLTGTGIGESSDNKLAVYSYSYGNDMQNVIINISDGTFNGDIALTGGSNKTNIETVNVTGGTFNGKFGELYSYGDDTAAAKAITITGGTFSTNYAEMYAIDNGFVFKANADGTYGVDENWITDTDAGKYNSGETTYGMMRFLFAIDIDKSEVVSSGIKYIFNKDISAETTTNVAGEATGTASNAFYGDIIEIPENTEGTYYAVAWVETAEKTYWSNPLGCTVSFEKFFADYTGGAQ